MLSGGKERLVILRNTSGDGSIGFLKSVIYIVVDQIKYDKVCR